MASTPVAQPTNYYASPGTLRRAIKWAADIMDFKDTPTITRFGLNGFNSVTGLAPASKTEWYEGTMRAKTMYPSVQLESGGGDLTLTVSAADGLLLRPGQILRHPNGLESIRIVASLVPATATFTISRLWTGVARQVWATTDLMEITGMAVADRAEPSYSSLLTHTLKTQYSTIFLDAVDLSWKEQKDWDAEEFGKPTLDSRLADLLPEMWEDLDKNFIYAEQKAGSSADLLSSFGGFEWYWPDTAANATSALGARMNYDLLEQAYTAAIDRGAKPNILMARPSIIRDLTKDIRDNGILNITASQTESKYGVRYTSLTMQDGDLDFVPNRHMRDDKAYLIQEDMVGLGTVVPWSYIDVPSTGLYSRRMVVGEYTMAIKHALEAHQTIILLGH